MVSLLTPLQVMAASQSAPSTSDESSSSLAKSTTSSVQTSTSTTAPRSTSSTNTGEPSTTTGESTTTTQGANPSSTDTTVSDEGDVIESELVLLPPPQIHFPVVGPSSFADTYLAPREGGAREHMGTDIFADRGAPVVASLPGVVETMGETDRAGLFVVLRHADGWRTAYVHLNNDSPGTDNGLSIGFGPGVEEGARVSAGTVIGYVGDSGNAEETAPHLHFEIHQPDGTRVNPYKPLRAALSVTDPSHLEVVNYDRVRVENIDFVAHLYLNFGFNADVEFSDQHLYVGTWGNEERCPGTGVRVVDVSTPAEPSHLTSFADHLEFPDTFTSALWVGDIDANPYTGRIGVVALSTCHASREQKSGSDLAGLAIYDLDTPAEPNLMALIPVEPPARGASSIDISVARDQVLLAASVPGSRESTDNRLEDVHLYEISDPSMPRLLNKWQPSVNLQLGSAFPIDPTITWTASAEAVLWVDKATLAIAGDSQTILTADFSDPTQPVVVSEIRIIDTPPALANVQQLVLQNPQSLLISQHFGSDQSPESSRLVFINAGDPTPHTMLTPQQTAATATSAPAEGLFYFGGAASHGSDRTVVAVMSGGVVVLDVATEGQPKELASFVPAPAIDPQRWWTAPNGTQRLAMAWDVVEHGGYAYVSDHHSGIWVVSLPPLSSYINPSDRPD